MRTLELAIDVSAAAGVPARLAASLHLPEDRDAAERLELLLCIHGAGYSRVYWDPSFAGRDYSFARYATDRGHAVLAVDLLGMGESSRPEPESLLSRAAVAAATEAALQEVVAGLKTGRWGLGARGVGITCVGHSLGGMMAITQAARFGSFDRLAVLGWANEPLVLHDAKVGDLSAATLAAGYVATPREPMRTLFYWPDVPQALIAADEAAASTTPACLGRDALTPGIVHEAAGQVACPVFLMYGEIDTSPDPRAEVAFFKKSPDVTLVVAPKTAHCHNFATPRRQLWDRLDAWMSGALLGAGCAS